MFLTRIEAKVAGRSTREALGKFAPDGRAIAEISLACGNGSVKFPTMYVKVCVWEKLAEKVLCVIDKKGINIEVSGFLLIRQYEGKRGKSSLVELLNVREVRVFDRNGELVEVFDGQ